MPTLRWIRFSDWIFGHWVSVTRTVGCFGNKEIAMRHPIRFVCAMAIAFPTAAIGQNQAASFFTCSAYSSAQETYYMSQIFAADPTSGDRQKNGFSRFLDSRNHGYDLNQLICRSYSTREQAEAARISSIKRYRDDIKARIVDLGFNGFR